MKKILISFTIIFSMMFTSVSFAEWTKVGISAKGDDFYVDFDRFRKHDGFVYFWMLSNYLEPTDMGTLSSETYRQVDCNLLRYKTLSWVFHEKPMGGDIGSTNNESEKTWQYAKPNSIIETVLNSVCK